MVTNRSLGPMSWVGGWVRLVTIFPSLVRPMGWLRLGKSDWSPREGKNARSAMFFGELKVHHEPRRVHLNCNTLQHSATHCNSLQLAVTHCNTLQQSSNGVVSTAVGRLSDGSRAVLVTYDAGTPCVVVCGAVCGAVCCSLLQCVAACYSVLQWPFQRWLMCCSSDL